MNRLSGSWVWEVAVLGLLLPLRWPPVRAAGGRRASQWTQRGSGFALEVVVCHLVGPLPVGGFKSSPSTGHRNKMGARAALVKEA